METQDLIGKDTHKAAGDGDEVGCTSQLQTHRHTLRSTVQSWSVSFATCDQGGGGSQRPTRQSRPSSRLKIYYCVQAVCPQGRVAVVGDGVAGFTPQNRGVALATQDAPRAVCCWCCSEFAMLGGQWRHNGLMLQRIAFTNRCIFSQQVWKIESSVYCGWFFNLFLFKCNKPKYPVMSWLNSATVLRVGKGQWLQ